MNLLFFLRGDFYISKPSVISGNITSAKNGSLAGTVNGDITIRGKLTIEKTGTLNGDVYAKEIVVKGLVKGNIYCEGKVYACKNAEINGNIIAREAMIDKESKVKGAISQIRRKKTETESVPEEELAETNMTAIANKLMPDDPPQNWF